jgi:hypothetical protein
MNRGRHRCRVAVALALSGILIATWASAICSQAHASNVLASVVVSSLEPDFLDEFSIHQSPTGSVSSFLDVQGIPNYPGFHATGTAATAFLSLGASSQVLLASYYPAAYDSTTLTSSTAAMDDMATIPGSGPGFVQFDFNLSGSEAASHRNFMRGDVYFRMTAGTNPGNTGLTVTSTPSSLPLGNFQTPLMPIIFGQAFPLYATLITSINTVSPMNHDGAMTAGIFYGNTVSFTGMHVYDANSDPVSSFSIASDSGTNYAAPPPLAGDFNNNGRVDAADYVTWRKGLGTTYTENDYNIWRAHFGQTISAGSGTAAAKLGSPAVPEPAAVMLCALALYGLTLYVANRRRHWPLHLIQSELSTANCKHTG